MAPPLCEHQHSLRLVARFTCCKTTNSNATDCNNNSIEHIRQPAAHSISTQRCTCVSDGLLRELRAVVLALCGLCMLLAHSAANESITQRRHIWPRRRRRSRVVSYVRYARRFSRLPKRRLSSQHRERAAAVVMRISCAKTKILLTNSHMRNRGEGTQNLCRLRCSLRSVRALL